LQADSTIVASVAPELSLGGALRMRVEEIAPTDSAAERQAAALATLVTMARGFTMPLTENAANHGLKELLKTATVTQKRNRVVVSATMPSALFAGLGQAADSSAQPTPSGAAK
jgi:hypothetical protein